MFSGMYGVNTMRISDIRRLFVVLLAAAAITVAGCGGEGGDSDVATDEPAPAGADSLTFEEELELQMNAVLDRLRYGDKSGLWENEFEYLREEHTFDKYLTERHVAWAEADTLKYLEIEDLKRFGDDSAVAEVVVHFENKGNETLREDTLTVYYHNGRWIKPTISSYKGQASFDSLRQAAIEAAEREAGQ